MGTNLTQRLFVYGSLKRGYALHDYLSAQKFLGTAVTKPLYRLYDCGSYPGMVHVAANGLAVTGEVYQISDRVRTVLDEVEGVNEGLYECQPVLLDEPFHSVEVLAYFYTQPISHLSDCGSTWPADEST